MHLFIFQKKPQNQGIMILAQIFPGKKKLPKTPKPI